MTTTLNSWTFTDIDELLAAVEQALLDAAREGHHPSTVYTGNGRMALVESTLTDGSKVLNLNVNVGDLEDAAPSTVRLCDRPFDREVKRLLAGDWDDAALRAEVETLTEVERHNGYTNRETYHVSLWLANEQHVYVAARHMALAATSELAAGEAIRESLRELLDLPEEDGGFAGDLIGLALARVNWREIGASFREDADSLRSEPETLNGHDVINVRQHANCSTVMVERGADLPFVVATWWPALGSTWSWGHYCHDRDEADAQFAEVAARNHRRVNLGS